MMTNAFDTTPTTPADARALLASLRQTDEHFFVTHVTMFGPAAVVSKLGRKWQIACRSISCQTLFATKREAIERVALMTSAIGRRLRLVELRVEFVELQQLGATEERLDYCRRCIAAFTN